jgi:hypothetical protein
VRSRGRKYGLSEPKLCSFGKQEFSEWTEGKTDKNSAYLIGKDNSFPKQIPYTHPLKEAPRQPSNQTVGQGKRTNRTDRAARASLERT